MLKYRFQSISIMPACQFFIQHSIELIQLSARPISIRPQYMVKQFSEINHIEGLESENNQESHQSDSQPNKQLLRRTEMKKMIADRFHLDASKRSCKQKQKRVKEKSSNHLLQEICREDTFLCSICCEIMVGPAIIECGHSFCVECAEKYSIYNLTCPICRSIQDKNEYSVSEITDRLIKQFVGQCMSEQQQERYNKRVADFENREKERRVDELRDCYLLDFKDAKLRCWKKGIVQEVDEKNKIATISPIENPHQVYKIHVKSRNLAKDEYYTGPMKKYQAKLFNENNRSLRNQNYQQSLTFRGFSSISLLRNRLYEIDFEDDQYLQSRSTQLQLRPVIGRGIISPPRSANSSAHFEANRVTEFESPRLTDMGQQTETRQNLIVQRQEERRRINDE